MFRSSSMPTRLLLETVAVPKVHNLYDDDDDDDDDAGDIINYFHLVVDTFSISHSG